MGKKALQLFGTLVIICSLIPFATANYWWIRGFDFPHLQLTFLTLLTIFILLLKYDLKDKKDSLIIGLLFICFAIQVIKIFPYTSLAKVEIADSTKSSSDRDIKVYTANVLQSNDQYELVIEQIRKHEPDLLLLLETTLGWQKAIEKELPDTYRFSQTVPQENTYGMLLYSKLPLLDPITRNLVSDTIPSIHCKVLLNATDTLQVFAIHPTPPMPTHNPMSTDRDAEMMKVAIASMKSDLPVIVMGDFNDVAWSRTTSLFEEVSGLLDLRKGRGLYNTYNATNIIMRWPLDHLFVSEHFLLHSIARGEKINSDHFPVIAHLEYDPQVADKQRMEPPSDDDLHQATEIAARVSN